MNGYFKVSGLRCCVVDLCIGWVMAPLKNHPEIDSRPLVVCFTCFAFAITFSKHMCSARFLTGMMETSETQNPKP